MAINDILEDEKVFNSAQKIKYLYQPAKSDSSHLIIVFSAFNPKGAPPAYNYIKTLQQLDVNKLFILDDQGERGSYYLGGSRHFDVEASVAALITYIANRNNIRHENIICCGSSKGGFASLYYSIKYSFGHAVVGAPQTFLGNYLKFAQEYPTLKFIAGDVTNDDIDFLNTLLFDVVRDSKKFPDITIHVGSGDHHYEGHVTPFKEHVQNYGHEVTLDVKDYSDHGDVKQYQRLLLEKLPEIIPSLKDSIKIEKVEYKINDKNIELSIICNKNAQYAWYVYRDGERILTEWYTDNSQFEYAIADSSIYHFLAFAKDEYGNIVTFETDKIRI